MARKILSMTLCFLILARASADKSENFFSALEENLENKLSNYVSNLVKWLENCNDNYLGNSELGRLLHYDEIKSKLEEARRSRSMKKMSMGMLPLIFHVGATSTWMVLTTILAAKSVAIGLALLVFKIAVSSAKVAAFFTTLKDKQQGWSWSPHHGHDRSLSGIEPQLESSDLYSYAPEWSPSVPHEYKTIPTYKQYSERDGPFQATSYVGDANSESH